MGQATLTRRISQYLKHDIPVAIGTRAIKNIAFAMSLLTCLCASSVLLFSFFSTSLHETYKISYLDVNLIASCSSIGLYLFLPILGYLGDCYGPSLLALILGLLFVPSYLVNANIVSNLNYSDAQRSHIYWFGLSFFFIGLATSSLYFLCLLTCAKIYPERKGLAISLPVTCYGMSSLIGSQVLKLSSFNPNGVLDIKKAFIFFSILYSFVCLLNFVSCYVVTFDYHILMNDHGHVAHTDDEEQSLLNPEDSNEFGAASSFYDEETLSLVPQRSEIEPLNHKQRYVNFLKDHSTWLLMISLILNIGPLESFQNNIGPILTVSRQAQESSSLSDQISVWAAASTASRILVGWLSDFMLSSQRKHPICRVHILSLSVFMGIIGVSIILIRLISFSFTSALVGSSYGALFTVYPTIVASVWGVDIMGSTWGTFMVAPALGSISYSILFGHTVDSGRSNGSLSDAYFYFVCISLFASAILVVASWRIFWFKRGLAIF